MEVRELIKEYDFNDPDTIRKMLKSGNEIQQEIDKVISNYKSKLADNSIKLKDAEEDAVVEICDLLGTKISTDDNNISIRVLTAYIIQRLNK